MSRILQLTKGEDKPPKYFKPNEEQLFEMENFSQQ